MNIVFDTNVIVSRLLSPSGIPARLVTLWEQQAEAVFDVLVSEPILAEYQKALTYPHVQSRHKQTTEQIDRYLAQFRKFATLVYPTQEVQVIQEDPDDNKFLACGFAGGADIIVSGDRHLLDVETYQGIHILRPADFLTFLKQEQAA